MVGLNSKDKAEALVVRLKAKASSTLDLALNKDSKKKR